MKKRIKNISAFAAAVCIAVLLLAQATATTALTFRGQVNWTNEPDTDTLRPEFVTVYLLADGEQVAQAETSAKEDWKFSFDVSPGSAAASAYTYSAAPVTGYEEDTKARVDPKTEEVPIAIGDWGKYEPCNSLEIPRELLSDMLIAGKMTKHRSLVIWSPEPLTATEQEMAEAAVRALPGVGNPPPAEFISGDGAEIYGMKILPAEGTVNFEDPSQWSLLFGSVYTAGRLEAGEGSLTMRWIPVYAPPAGPAPAQPAPEETPPAEKKQESEETPAPESKPGDRETAPAAPGRPAAAGGTVVAAKTGIPADYYVSVCSFFCALAMIAGLLIRKKSRKTA